jgi:hypothetical protein
MTVPLGKGSRRELLKLLKWEHRMAGQMYGVDQSLFEDCAKVMEDDAGRIRELTELLTEASLYVTKTTLARRIESAIGSTETVSEVPHE